MSKKVKRFILVGVDGFQLPMAQRFANEGALPNIKRLLEQGSCGELLPCLPSWTPTNWGTIATGAYPGTTGLSGWFRRSFNDLEGKRDVSNFDSRACGAETIWEAAEREGVRSLAINHPASWPPRVKKSMVVAPLVGGPDSAKWSIAGVAVWSVKAHAPAVPGAAVARGAKPSPGEARPLAVKIADGRFVAEFADSGGVPLRAVFDPLTRTLAICSATGKRLAKGTPGEWFGPVWLDYGAKGKGGSYFHLSRLDPANRDFIIAQTGPYPRTGYTHPKGLAPAISAACGPFVEAANFKRGVQGVTEEMILGAWRLQGLWMARVAKFLLEREGWQLYYQHYHIVDAFAHPYLSVADPDHPQYNPKTGAQALDIMRRMYQVVDQVVGEFLTMVDGRTALMILSDHGNVPNFFAVDYVGRLEETGLLARENGKIVWEKTKAYMLDQRITDIYINLKGRNPKGVVDPADYVKVQNEIIDALLDWRNPHNPAMAPAGERIVAYALKKKDAHIVGYYGEEAGDVVFVLNSGYGRGGGKGAGTVKPASGANHGPQIATTKTRFSSNPAGAIVAGPGIRAGYCRDYDKDGFWNLVDVVPTIAHILGFTPPRDARGGVMLDLFE